MTETRIRWEDEPPGYAAVLNGFAGPDDWNWRAFVIYHAIDGSGYSLVSWLTGRSGRELYGGDIDVLKAEAERWLSGFVSSLGAVFEDEYEEFDEARFRAQYAPGRRVRFDHPDAGWPGEGADAREILVFGGVYRIAWSEIGQSKIYLALEGIWGSTFNSVLFEPVDDEPRPRYGDPGPDPEGHDDCRTNPCQYCNADDGTAATAPREGEQDVTPAD